jgi:hypothetical protein
MDLFSWSVRRWSYTVTHRGAARMNAATHALTADRLIALSDTELAAAFVDLAEDLAVVDSELGGPFFKLVEALDGLLTETLERLSPEAGRTATITGGRRARRAARRARGDAPARCSADAARCSSSRGARPRPVVTAFATALHSSGGGDPQLGRSCS